MQRSEVVAPEASPEIVHTSLRRHVQPSGISSRFAIADEKVGACSDDDLRIIEDLGGVTAGTSAPRTQAVSLSMAKPPRRRSVWPIAHALTQHLRVRALVCAIWLLAAARQGVLPRKLPLRRVSAQIRVACLNNAPTSLLPAPPLRAMAPPAPRRLQQEVEQSALIDRLKALIAKAGPRPRSTHGALRRA